MKHVLPYVGLIMACQVPLVHAEYLDDLRLHYSVGQARGEVDSAAMNSRLQQLGYQADAQVRDLSRRAKEWHLEYRFNPYLAVQAGYYDLGEVRTHISGVPADIADFLQSTNVIHPRSADGKQLGLQARYPLHQDWDLQLGYHRYWQKSQYLSYTANQLAELPRDSQQNGWSIGLGYQWSEDWQVSLQYRPVKVQGESINAWFIGVNYRFWQQQP